MNWTVVVCTGVFLIAAVYWIFFARFHFQGPKRKDLLIEEEKLSPDFELDKQSPKDEEKGGEEKEERDERDGTE